MKYFIYARKSTDEPERQILSIEAQIEELREFANKEGLEVLKTYIESQTAKKPGRPIFNEMLSDIEKGKADGILAWHPDRLARNSMDGGKIIYLIDAGKMQSLNSPLSGSRTPLRESLCSTLPLDNLNTTWTLFQRM